MFWNSPEQNLDGREEFRIWRRENLWFWNFRFRRRKSLRSGHLRLRYFPNLRQSHDQQISRPSRLIMKWFYRFYSYKRNFRKCFFVQNYSFQLTRKVWLNVWPPMKCLFPIDIGKSTSSNLILAVLRSNRKDLKARGMAGILFHPSTSKIVGETRREAIFFAVESCSRIPLVSILTPSRAKKWSK